MTADSHGHGCAGTAEVRAAEDERLPAWAAAREGELCRGGALPAAAPVEGRGRHRGDSDHDMNLDPGYRGGGQQGPSK